MAKLTPEVIPLPAVCGPCRRNEHDTCADPMPDPNGGRLDVVACDCPTCYPEEMDG